MRRVNRFMLLALSIASALAIFACGDDDDGDGGGGGDEAQITEVIETSVKSTDPADCTELQTQNFVEQVQFGTGEEAVSDCEADASDTSDDPDSVEVADVEVDGTSATANASFVGSAFDGSTVSLALVKEGEQWKLDQITDIPEFNFEAFQQGFSEQLTAAGEVPPQIVTCIEDALAKLGPEQAKEAFLSGDENQLVGLFGECLGGA